MYINLHHQRGVGMLEVLVAILLLAVGVLGFSALQVRAVTSTSEGLFRTQAMGLMRTLAEDMRDNASVLDQYRTSINNRSTTAPAKTCMGNSTGSENPCSAAQMAIYDSYQLNLMSVNQGIVLNVATCPGLVESRTCILAAWGGTRAVVGADSDKDCVKSDGVYHRKATCLMLEAV